ncbi:MAG: 50S ribosomal protein L6 [Flavobacteriales bacterium]|nr:50S ribosomal protein L6 [Flavobacteriales bacterium]|tara:strand:+ start:2649 stop:3197 length:549 start_codon:yes stop_codon:yes gene_type:complete
MSRIGNAPVSLPQGVEVKFNNGEVTVKGKLGESKQRISDGISVKVSENEVVISRENETKDLKSKHGLYRSLISNMVVGVTEGYTTKQELIGVGFRAKVTGQLLEMNLGFSHNVVFSLPDEVKVTAEQSKGQPPVVTFTSIDKQLVGQVAAKLRSLRKPEPYKGKGIKYVGEQIRRKAGKSAG